jgi:hypothetical protein
MKLSRIIGQQLAKLDSDEFQSFCKHFFWGLFILYASYQAYIFMHWRAMVPDEISFIGMAHGFNFFDRVAPPANYGSVYWLTLKTLHHPALIRFFMGALFLTIPLLVVCNQKNYQLKLIGLLLYLSFPYAFWTGKLIGPEIPALWCMALSLSLLPSKLSWSAIFAGLSVGIKLTSLPFLIFYIPLAIIQNGSIKNLTKFFLLVACGFLLANPINSDLYLTNIIRGNIGDSQSGVAALTKINNVLFYYGITWDNVISLSFSQLISNPYLCLAYGLILLVGAPLYGAIFLIFILATIITILSSPITYAWYFFPIIPVWIYTIRYLDPLFTQKIRSKILWLMIGAIFLINFLVNIQYSIFQSAEKFKQINTIEQYPKSCVFDEISKFNPTVIMDRSDFGWGFNGTPEGSKFQMEDLLTPNHLNNNERFMLIASSRMLIHIPKNFSLKLQKNCQDIFIFTNL